MDAFETSVGYRSLLPALCPKDMEALQQLSEEELLQLAKDSFDADLAEALRSTGEWHWKLEIRDVVANIAEALSCSDQDRYESVRAVLLTYYAEQYRRPTGQEYRTYLREKRAQKLSMSQELVGYQKGEVPYGPVREEELACFEVTYTVHSMYSTEITASTLEELRTKVEIIYDKTDLDRFAFDSHDEDWKPLNAAARRLLIEEDAKEQETRRGQDDTHVNGSATLPLCSCVYDHLERS
jgi:hypothetical protein